MHKTTLYLLPELLASFTELARTRKRARAELMREALQEYVERQEPMLPDWIGMIETEGEFDSTNVKSWLRDNWKQG